ncbi:hypothetical protein AAFC00_004317 [Neodothiora populina]|uniref:EthD domain-containing protein n=1 Tax=Neodothiora populina TaxID=2781224 RepID=A0ABR3PJA6_9PEZI
MPASVIVQYPQGSKFDMDYYLSSHMPLVAKHWGPAGLKSWKVLKFGDDQPYLVQATLEWGDMSEFQKASQGPATKEIMDDVSNFCDKSPILMPGEVVGSS